MHESCGFSYCSSVSNLQTLEDRVEKELISAFVCDRLHSGRRLSCYVRWYKSESLNASARVTLITDQKISAWRHDRRLASRNPPTASLSCFGLFRPPSTYSLAFRQKPSLHCCQLPFVCCNTSWEERLPLHTCMNQPRICTQLHVLDH